MFTSGEYNADKFPFFFSIAGCFVVYAEPSAKLTGFDSGRCNVSGFRVKVDWGADEVVGCGTARLTGAVGTSGKLNPSNKSIDTFSVASSCSFGLWANILVNEIDKENTPMNQWISRVTPQNLELDVGYSSWFASLSERLLCCCWVSLTLDCGSSKIDRFRRKLQFRNMDSYNIHLFIDYVY